MIEVAKEICQMKLRLALVGLLLITVPCCAQRERISSMLKSMENGGPVPSENVFWETVDSEYVNQLSTDRVSEFLRPAGRLLRDARPDARRYGLMCFHAVTLRPSLDGGPLMEPYVPDLLRIYSDRTDPFRETAMAILSRFYPKTSRMTLDYLKAHLADKENETRHTGWMACTLLATRDDTLTRDVIAFVRKQDNAEVIMEVLTCVRVRPILKTADVLSLIGYGLDSPAEWTRRRAVEAAADLPLVERSPFLAQLNRLAADPKEISEIRAAAANALKK
ncbi:MAG: hypothetical protein QM757_35540 [Paludibaculum sp.]